LRPLYFTLFLNFTDSMKHLGAGTSQNRLPYSHSVDYYFRLSTLSTTTPRSLRPEAPPGFPLYTLFPFPLAYGLGSSGSPNSNDSAPPRSIPSKSSFPTWRFPPFLRTPHFLKAPSAPGAERALLRFLNRTTPLFKDLFVFIFGFFRGSSGAVL